MRLQEAIKYLEEDCQHPTANFMPELQAAQRLGIEALKAIRGARYFPLPNSLKRLIGETEE